MTPGDAREGYPLTDQGFRAAPAVRYRIEAMGYTFGGRGTDRRRTRRALPARDKPAAAA